MGCHLSNRTDVQCTYIDWYYTSHRRYTFQWPTNSSIIIIKMEKNARTRRQRNFFLFFVGSKRRFSWIFEKEIEMTNDNVRARIRCVYVRLYPVCVVSNLCRAQTFVLYETRTSNTLNMRTAQFFHIFARVIYYYLIYEKPSRRFYIFELFFYRRMRVKSYKVQTQHTTLRKYCINVTLRKSRTRYILHIYTKSPASELKEKNLDVCCFQFGRRLFVSRFDTCSNGI